MAIYVWGLVGIVVFYIAMLGIGIWAGTKQKNQGEEEVMLAGRSIGTIVGCLTLIGAWQHFSFFSSSFIFSIDSSHKNCPSARCASAANTV
jgi:Na+/proline symporter